MGAYGGLCIGPLLMTGQLTSDNSRTPRRASVNGLLRVRLRPTYSTLHLNDGVLGLGLPHQHLMPGSWRAHVRCSAAPAGRLRCRRRRKEKDTEQGRIERCGAPVWQQTKGGAGLGSAIRQRKQQKLGRQPLPLRLALSPFALNFGFISDSERAILFCSRLASPRALSRWIRSESREGPPIHVHMLGVRKGQTEGHMRPMPPETALHDAFLTGNVAVPAESHARPGPSGLRPQQQPAGQATAPWVEAFPSLHAPLPPHALSHPSSHLPCADTETSHDLPSLPQRSRGHC